MASVSSLDRDLRTLRLSKYTPQAAKEVRTWIEEVLQEPLPVGDLLEALKDGVALCRLINLAVGSPGVKYKESRMPFVQMENISHFLRACQLSPLQLPPHDVFLTVDLYEGKDPAQVLQCLGAFSRRANAIQPTIFPRAIGKGKSDVVSPQISGSGQGVRFGAPYPRSRGVSNASNPNIARSSSPKQLNRSPASPISPSRPVSAWTNKAEEATTAPAWNIHQYGYMGGASQANMGVTFGSIRQIVSPSPVVPTLAEKERRRKEKENKARIMAEEEEEARRQEAEREKLASIREQQRWEEETKKLREKERQEVQEEKQRWEAEQRRWEEEEEHLRQEERESEDRLEQDRYLKRDTADTRLNGQFLSQYKANQCPTRGGVVSPVADKISPTPESERIKALERELELAKERERQYELERQQLALSQEFPLPKPHSQSHSKPRPTPPKPSYDLTSQEHERRLLREEWKVQSSQTIERDDNTFLPDLPPRSLPAPPPPKPPRASNPPTSPRPLPDPANYLNKNRTDRFLQDNLPPTREQPMSHRPQDYSSTAEVDEENRRRIASTQKTRAGGWASKSLLEREMERERERQREWEENQSQTREAVERGVKTAGSGPGEGAWDVNQYGYLGGDSQARSGAGINFGMRRQIIGPRPPP
ncbi:hypothetical protein FQN57_002290 [Myotisia sp. PD_48]|nr:hypothetical protein FQN57_002290 [Myotisia sp. PD_48]